MRGQCLNSDPMPPRYVPGKPEMNRIDRAVSGLNKLHLGTGKLDQVAILE